MLPNPETLSAFWIWLLCWCVNAFLTMLMSKFTCSDDNLAWCWLDVYISFTSRILFISNPCKYHDDYGYVLLLLILTRWWRQNCVFLISIYSTRNCCEFSMNLENCLYIVIVKVTYIVSCCKSLFRFTLIDICMTFVTVHIVNTLHLIDTRNSRDLAMNY